MVRVVAGEVYTAERVRSGNSAKGSWELLVVKNGKDEMTLWLENPGTGIVDGEEFRIKSIKSFEKKNVPYLDGRVCKDRNAKNIEWRMEVVGNVTVEPVGFSQMPSDFNNLPNFEELPDFDISENPFAANDNAFADGLLPF